MFVALFSHVVAHFGPSEKKDFLFIYWKTVFFFFFCSSDRSSWKRVLKGLNLREVESIWEINKIKILKHVGYAWVGWRSCLGWRLYWHHILSANIYLINCKNHIMWLVTLCLTMQASPHRITATAIVERTQKIRRKTAGLSLSWLLHQLWEL